MCILFTGMTEVGGVTSFGMEFLFNPDLKELREKHRSSVGQPNAGMQFIVVDEDGKRLGPNEVGELCVDSKCMMKGYLCAEDTKTAFLDGKWIKTGDYGYYSEDGFIYWKERKKELLKYKGFHVVSLSCIH